MTDRGYHHGDLRNALLAATKKLVRERGPRGFSVSEAARLVGVSSSAPYRHFADRDAMLAAAALTGFLELEERFSQLPVLDDLTTTAAEIAREYVDFAREDPARFEVMFTHGIDKAEHDELLAQTIRIQQRLEATLRRHVPTSDATHRAAELWSLAHGAAALAVGENMQHVVPENRISELAERTATMWAQGVLADVARNPSS
jgi:AcrR family transcriptional regulator